MPDMSSVKNDVHFSLFKGEPGTRKSTAALSFPLPQYWFSFDRKMNALSIPMKKWGIDPSQVQFDDYTDWIKARQKLEQFQISCSYKTVVIDSITSIADAMLRGSIAAKGGSSRKVAGISVNEIDDFQAEAAGLMELIALAKDVHKYNKIDIILIAHVIRTENRLLDGKTNITRVLVTAGKKPAAKIPAYCDETYHFGVEPSVDMSKGGDYIIQTANAGDDFARTTLELPTIIQIGGDKLYEKHIKPAIEKQQSK